MYTLESLSKLSGLSVETIHSYERAGLLSPVETDETTGKSLYTSKELVTLHSITAYVQMGFTLDDIRNFLHCAPSDIDLEKKRSQLMRKISRLNRKLTDIDDYLLEAEECNVVVKSLPEMLVAIKKVTVSSMDDIYPLANEFSKELESMGCEAIFTEHRFIVIHGEKYEEGDFTVRLCLTVDQLKPDTDTIEFKKMPVVEKAACSYHKGAYSTLHMTHAFSALWMDYHNHVIDGDFHEIYIDGIWNKDSADEWLTEIQVPLKSAH